MHAHIASAVQTGNGGEYNTTAFVDIPGHEYNDVPAHVHLDSVLQPTKKASYPQAYYNGVCMRHAIDESKLPMTLAMGNGTSSERFFFAYSAQLYAASQGTARNAAHAIGVSFSPFPPLIHI